MSHADLWEEFWQAHDAIGPPVLLHKVWRSHATEAEIAAGIISLLEAHGNEAADKLAARGALRNALSMEYVAATRSPDLRVRLVQNQVGRDDPVARPKQDQNCLREGQGP